MNVCFGGWKSWSRCETRGDDRLRWMNWIRRASLTGLDSTESKMIDQSQRSSHFGVLSSLSPLPPPVTSAVWRWCPSGSASWFSSAADRRGFLRGGGGGGDGVLSWSLGCATHDQREKRNDEFLHVCNKREGDGEARVRERKGGPSAETAGNVSGTEQRVCRLQTGNGKLASAGRLLKGIRNAIKSLFVSLRSA